MKAIHKNGAASAIKPRAFGMLLDALSATSGAKRSGSRIAASALMTHRTASATNPPFAPEREMTHAASAAASTNCASV
jgi:hypothetical protein